MLISMQTKLKKMSFKVSALQCRFGGDKKEMLYKVVFVEKDFNYYYYARVENNKKRTSVT